MADIFSQAFIDKIDSAIANKEGKNKDKIQAKLINLQNYISELDQRKQSITDEDSYQKYINFLKKAIESTIEQISAPTVDDFIVWVDSITGDDKKSGKFRDFLIKNYSDRISSYIDSILSTKNVLDKENLLFASLIAEIRKIIKKDCNAFLDKPAEFENKIDGFMEELNKNLEGLNSIDELNYTKTEDLYSDEQKKNNIDFYKDIIRKFVKVNQKLDAISDSDKSDDIVTKTKNRIIDIKKCINILDKTEIANNTDDTVKELFLLFSDDMVKFEKGISQNLNEFLEQKWNDIILQYDTIKSFFDTIKEIPEENNWKSFKTKDEIAVVVLKYNSIKKDNPLNSLKKQKSILSIQQTLTKKFNDISDYNKDATKAKQAILDVFNNTIKEYSEKLELIEKLDSDKLLLYNKIKVDGVEALKNGVEAFKNKEIINYLIEDFASDLNTYNNLKSWFDEVLQKSGLSQEYEWLNTRLNDLKSGDISVNEFDENIIKVLLSEGLIELTITKTF